MTTVVIIRAANPWNKCFALAFACLFCVCCHKDPRSSSKEELLLVPMGYWKQFKTISVEEQRKIESTLNVIPGMISPELSLTLRQVVGHINKRLTDEHLEWRVFIEIRGIQDSATTNLNDPFKGAAPVMPVEYLDAPITTLQGKQLTTDELVNATSTMSIQRLIDWAASTHNLTILWLSNKRIILVNHVA